MMAQAQEEAEQEESDTDNQPTTPEQSKRKLRKG